MVQVPVWLVSVDISSYEIKGLNKNIFLMYSCFNYKWAFQYSVSHRQA